METVMNEEDAKNAVQVAWIKEMRLADTMRLDLCRMTVGW